MQFDAREITSSNLSRVPLAGMPGQPPLCNTHCEVKAKSRLAVLEAVWARDVEGALRARHENAAPHGRGDRPIWPQTV